MSFLVRLLRPMARRSIEDPNVPLSIDAFADLFSTTTKTGVKMTRKRALGYAAVWRAVNLIAGDVAALPLDIFERTEEGGKRRASEHPAANILRWAANSDTNAFVFRQTLMGHVLLDGNAYAAILRDGAGRPTALVQLDPQRVNPVRDTASGQLWYVVDLRATGETIRLFPEEVFHLRGLGFDGLVGYSVLSLAAESLGLGLAARDHGAVFFRNAATPKVVLEHPGRITKNAADRMRSSWERMHTGIDQAHRTAILEEGTKAHALSISARDAQFLEMRQFEVREVANWFHLPPHKLGDDTRTSFKSLEQEERGYLSGTLNRWLVAFEMESREKLLTEDEKRSDSHVIEFNRRALVQADFKTRTEGYASAIQNGWMNRDEVRNAENLDPIPGGDGKTFFLPLNVTPVGGNPPNGDDGEEEGMASLRTRAESLWKAALEARDEAFQRARNRLANAADRARSPEEFLRDLSSHEEPIAGILAPALRLIEAWKGSGQSQASPETVARSLLDRIRDELRSLDWESWPESLRRNGVAGTV